MEISMEILELSRRVRQDSNIKGRKPVKEMMIYSEAPITDSTIQPILEELNARSIRIIKKEDRPVKITTTVDKSVSAPILKKEIAGFERYVSDEKNLETLLLETEGHNYNGVVLPPESVIFSEIVMDGFMLASSEKGDLTLYLNTEINDDLELEGLSREIIRRLQVMRKELLLEYTDNVKVTYSSDENVKTAINRFKEKIMSEVQAISIEFDGNINGRRWDIDGINIRIKIDKVK
ncbi:isoleucyl-tRNA synthetase, partial [mine drainage metagenome]